MSIPNAEDLTSEINQKYVCMSHVKIMVHVLSFLEIILNK